MYSKCPTCGSNRDFTPRLDLESVAMKDNIRADYDPTTRPEIDEILSLLDKDYQDYESEITRLQLQVAALSSRKRRLKVYEAKLRNLAAPIRKLPNEMLMLIFDHVSQDNRMREYPHLASPLWHNTEDGLIAMPALVLSSICSRWRELALSFSALWSRISLILMVELDECTPGEQLTKLVATVKLYVERSGTSLLRLRIHTDGDFVLHESAPHPVLSLLGNLCHRWQKLTFFGDNFPSCEIFAISYHVGFPMLEELEFDAAHKASLEVFEGAPKLKSLDVGFRGRLDNIVDLCPNLTSLRFHSDELPPAPTPPRAFTNLQSLSLIMTDDHEEEGLPNLIDLVVSSFTCPSLTSLTLEGRSILSNPRMLHSLETFLIRSSCALTNLSIRGLQPSGDAVIAIMEQLTSLTSLTIEDVHLVMDSSETCTITPAFIQSLHSTFCLSSTPLLPKLRYLSLRYPGQDFCDAGVVDMIQSRCLSEANARRIGIEPLQSLVLRSQDRTPTLFGEVAEIYEPLRRLKEAGFRLIVEGILE